jgi:hypothetical protein
MDPKDVKGLPYGTKIALTKFMGSPIDSSLSQQSIMNNQANFMTNRTPPPQQQAPQQKSSLGGLSKLSLSNRNEPDMFQGKEKLS